MKFLVIIGFLFLTIGHNAFAQSNFYVEGSTLEDSRIILSIPEIEQPLTSITLQQSTGLSAVYLVNDENKTISSSYEPTSSYRFRHPENKALNCYFSSGNPEFINRDSYNPFGARSLEECIVLGVVNTVFSKFIKNTQKPRK